METELYKAQGVRYCITPKYDKRDGADNTLCEQRTIELLNQLNAAFLPVTLMIEDDNAYDPYAVAVYYMGDKVAYLDKTDAKDLRSHLDGKSGEVPLCCRIIRVEVSKKGWFYVEKPKVCASAAHLLPACDWDSSLSIRSQEYQLKLQHLTDVAALEQMFYFLLQPLFEAVSAASSSDSPSSSEGASSSPVYDFKKLGELLDQQSEPWIGEMCKGLESWMEKVWYIFTVEVTECVKNFRLCLSECKHPKLQEMYTKMSCFETRRASATSLGRLRTLWQQMVEGVAQSKPWLDYLNSLNPQTAQIVLNPQTAQNPQIAQNPQNPQNSPNPTYSYKMQLYKELVQVNEKLSKLPKRLSDWIDDAPQLILAMNYFDPPQHIFHGVVSLLIQRVLISLELVNLMKQNVSNASSHPKLDVSSASSNPERGDYGMEDWVKNARVPVRDIVDFVKRKCPEESSMHFVESLLQELKAKDYGLSLSDIEEACKLPKPTLQPSTIHVENVEKVIGTLAGDVAKQEIST